MIRPVWYDVLLINLVYLFFSWLQGLSLLTATPPQRLTKGRWKKFVTPPINLSISTAFKKNPSLRKISEHLGTALSCILASSLDSSREHALVCSFPSSHNYTCIILPHHISSGYEPGEYIVRAFLTTCFFTSHNHTCIILPHHIPSEKIIPPTSPPPHISTNHPNKPVDLVDTSHDPTQQY